VCPVCTIEGHYLFYCSLLKPIDLINLENACEYFAVKSVGGGPGSSAGLYLVLQSIPLEFLYFAVMY